MYSYLHRFIEEPTKEIENIINTKISIIDKYGLDKVDEKVINLGFEAETISEIEKMTGDILITISNNDLKFLSNVNKIVVDNNIKWIPVVIRKEENIVGPFVIGKNSSCYECFIKANNRNYKNEFFIDTNSKFMIESIKDQLYSIITDSIIQIVCNHRKETLWGKCYIISNRTGLIDKKVIPKAFLCDVCGKFKNDNIRRWEYEL